MNRILIAAFALLLGTTGAALAHGSKKHILGIVARIDSGSLVVETKDGKNVEVKIVPATVFLRDDKAAVLRDITLGDHVAVHATLKGTSLEAEEVRIGAAPPRKKPKP